MDAYKPTLTLEPDREAPAAPELTVMDIEKEKAVVQQAVDELSRLSPEEQAVVSDFASKINITDSGQVLSYGSAAQKKLASFSDTALEKVKTKDLGEVGEMMTNLITELKGFNLEEEDKKGIRGWFRRSSNQLAATKAKFDSCEANVEKIAGMLEDHQITLLKDIAVMDKMYDLNLAYFKELTMYILAGKKKLEEFRATTLKEAVEKAQKSNLPEDAQAANDLANYADRFEKKLYDLELTRNVSIQMAPQIRLLQNNDSLMAEKIQSTIVNTIPLWKSQMLLALGLENSRRAMEAQRAVSDMTNELLKRNAEALKLGSIETAKESERGIVDIETLKATNQSLISTLDEVMKIQEDGRVKRRAAEQELTQIENELKAKLLSARA
ncbi:MAG: toxic anion resistance protein [Eubacteriales bacterium]|nr:toxic anion resistance protein [Clostridiales bacterium]MDY3071150.1 toxic anion resistance protein [Eubacteriales bacterium]MDY3286588.1 toxic anion resistance protein [Eubacteriales bacterium]MDY5016086.1 toxic anion resistance protein [Eubacteriales bacterium]